MSPSKSPIPHDTIMELHRQGISTRGIGIRLGMTKNAVIGQIYRYKKRGGPPKPRPKAKPLPKIPTRIFNRVTLTAFRNYGLTDKARSVAMYLLCVSAGYGPTRTARRFGCEHHTVSTASRRVEDWRDDPVFDAELTALEEKNTPGY